MPKTGASSHGFLLELSREEDGGDTVPAVPAVCIKTRAQPTAEALSGAIVLLNRDFDQVA